jgi:hypothetical protein
VVVRADAFDAVGVEKVELFAGMTLIGTRTGAPFEVVFDSTTFPDGAVALTAVAYDASGNSATSPTVAVTVSNVPNAAYDPNFGAPRCTAAGSFCSSGELLLGRAGMPAEPNGPNTVLFPTADDRCKDGALGAFHVDESIDALRVFTADGFPLAAGVPATLEAAVWAYSAYDADRLDLYAAADPYGFIWTYLGTFAPSGPGAQVLSTQFVLPAEGTQIVRARYRYGGAAASCGTGSYDDHDDLSFVVTSNMAYEPSLGAPACARVATFCDSGLLFAGRASLGPEQHAPNTLTGSPCADGAEGVYRTEPSIEAIRVETVDGSLFGPGKQAQVEVKVWASGSGWETERLDVYSAPSASSPVWTLVGTLAPAGPGAKVLSMRYPLPAGSVQAVRAHYRDGGDAAACGTGAIDDHDDLAFAVGQ